MVSKWKGTAMAGWFVAISHWGKQEFARKNLEKLSFKCYFPKFLETIIARGKKIILQKFLFGRYFFVRWTENWRHIFNVKGIFGILMNVKGEPSRIREEVVVGIKNNEGCDGFIKIEKKYSSYWFKRGERIRITRGKLIGYHAKFDRGYGGERVKILLDFMGRETPIIMKLDEISSIEEVPRRRRYRGNRGRKRVQQFLELGYQQVAV